MNSLQKPDIEELEEILGYTFKDESLLLTAVTHSSYANEAGRGSIRSNERLEFLGDAVLDMVVSRDIFTRMSDKAEGELTKIRASLVCERSLAQIGKRIGINRFMRLGRGEDGGGGRERDSIVADCAEAIIGAVYIDGGFAAASECVLRQMMPAIEAFASGKVVNDSKSELQELLQRSGTRDIEYSLVKEEGPDHAKVFTMSVSVDGKVIGTGTGRSKKLGEAAAASDALARLSGNSKR